MGAGPVERAHFCHDCEEWYLGFPDSSEKLADDYPCGFNYDDVETYTTWYCGDPRGPCELDEEPETRVNIWFCTGCERIYEDIADAMDCCAND